MRADACSQGLKTCVATKSPNLSLSQQIEHCSIWRVSAVRFIY